MLEGLQAPKSDGFVPEYESDDCPEREDEQVFSCEALHQHRYVGYVEG